MNNIKVTLLLGFCFAAALVFITTYILLKNKTVINPVGYYLLYLFLVIFLCFTYRNNGVGIFEKPNGVTKVTMLKYAY